MAQNSYNSHSDKKHSNKIPTFGDVVSAVNTAYKTVDELGRAAIEKSNAFFGSVFDLSIDSFCDFNSKNRACMERLMRINDLENELTLDTIGSDAYESGDSRNISANVLHPSYAVERDYILNYYNTIVSDTSYGLNTTVAPRDENANIDDENEGYGRDTKLYFDDNGTLSFDSDSGVYGRGHTISTNNRNSILYKTKRLFREHKINTIISRFHTNPMNHRNGDPTSPYGLSHGRNLLTKRAENGESYTTNGYDNPYCRVWTHHYQYDRLDKLIRPFYTKDGNGKSKLTTLKGFHTWNNFKTGKEWGWKNGNKEWDNVVLNDNGFVNFTPSFNAGGRTNIHTKQCMFSIENLAWKGFDPYSFEKALSWEQRGPNGGRIMWFAPYGISFSESTNTDWNEHTFIGRGESVYTYANTRRTGTLGFMLVVDHPSIVDYVTWRDANGVSDTDMLRFFAGCDGGSSGVTSNDSEDGNNQNQLGGGLSDSAFPTPLTDEYVEVAEELSEEETKEAIPMPDPPVEEYEEPHSVGFFVFYPNNYSGHYDSNNPDIDPMAYLLAGVGAQTEYDKSNPINSITKPLLFNDMANGETGNGYEMGNQGISDISQEERKTNYIHGTAQTWRVAKQRNSRKWIPAPDGWKYKWYYRIDGEYTSNGQVDESDMEINCFDQCLVRKASYEDSRSYRFNSDANEVRNKLSTLLPMEDDLYSFAEVAYVLSSEENKTIIEKKTGNKFDTTRIEEIQKILQPEDSKSQITEIKVVGYSNSHGVNTASINYKRNTNLAKQRAESVANWLKECVDSDIANKIIIGEPEIAKDAGDKGSVESNSVQAKGYRSAYVRISYKTTEVKSQAESNSSVAGGEVNYVGFEREVDIDGNTTGFKDEEGNMWQYDSDRNLMIRKVSKINKKLTDRSGYGSFRVDKIKKGIQSENGEDETNKIRYDQEYHFFKVLEKENPIVFSSLMKKLQYFDPAFHSTTPEGFNARLTFLSQCMRQGNTLTISDSSGIKGQLTNNLAFGRAPYCVLRLGDFYNQLIIIDNITVTYDPLQWDLNTEGVGVQPLLANVQISFKFVGGGDLSGPIRRLQNAMTFNYYANTQLYDNRADRLDREFDYRTNTDKEVDNDKVQGYFHDVKMQGK